ncbi:MAG: hypothetical protein L3J69_00040 [Desulfobacula sp.]|nr:hypothetical protein [Desulfobacula sp.]
MQVKKFRLTQLDDQYIEIKHGLSYSIDLSQIGPVAKFLLTRIFKQYGYRSIEHYIKGQDNATPIFLGSDFIALPVGKGKQLFDLATDTNSMWKDTRNF